jgi:hypothetical protein
MTVPPIGGVRAAEIHANPIRAFRPEAYSDAGRRRKQSGRKRGRHRTKTCKPRANCLKPKEIGKPAQSAATGVLTCGTSRFI